ncbi:MAG: DHH family phosphoesterase [Candidatus Caldarchaeum sp.]
MRNIELVKRLHRTISENCRFKRTQILTHWGGDADAVGAAFVLSQTLLENYEAEEVGFIIPEEKSAHVKAIMRHLSFGEKYIENPDVYLLVDVGSLSQLGHLRSIVTASGKPVICVDHHLQNSESPNIITVSSSNYLATSEIVYDLLEFLGLKIDKRYAEPLFLGMYYDTVRLSVADAELARKAAALLNHIVPSQLVGMLEPQMEEAERIARLKALKRITVYRMGEWYVTVTTVNAYLSAVARSLVNAGAHIALVGGLQNDMAVISMRSSPDFQKYAGISLGEDLVKHLLKKFEGDGGGHAGAARVRLRSDVVTALSEAVKGLALLLGANSVELTS